MWSQFGSEIYYDTGNVGIDVTDPQTKLHVSGGNWDTANGEGDFKIGNSSYRLKMGVATAGGGAGTCRVAAGGPDSRLILGANGQDRLTVTADRVGINTLYPSADLDVNGSIETDGFKLTAAPTAGHVLTCDSSGNASWQAPTGGGGFSLPYAGTYGGSSSAFSVTSTYGGVSACALQAKLDAPGSSSDASAAIFDATDSNGYALICRGQGVATLRVEHEDTGSGIYVHSQDTGVRVVTTGDYDTALDVDASGADSVAISADASGGAIGIVAKGPYAAGQFYGHVDIYEYGTSNKVLELGKGLDYAEGFDVTDSSRVVPGMVLVIDPRNAGKLVGSTSAYDRKVAGIVAGANGLGSGVRLGGQEFDHNVALAGRVYCNVVAGDGPIVPGDLLTTSDVPGYAMKVGDHQRAHGAILGKAMQPLAKGERGQILVLVTLQ